MSPKRAPLPPIQSSISDGNDDGRFVIKTILFIFIHLSKRELS